MDKSKTRHKDNFLMTLRNKSYFYPLLILILLIPVVFRLIRPGYFFMQDDLQAFRIQQMDKCFQDGQFPCRWVPDAGYGYGYPQFNFYPPSVYYFGEAFYLMGMQFVDSVKVMFVLGYILSALAMYLFVKDLLADRFAGFVSAILYTYIPYKAVEVYVRGALNEFWAFVFFPLILWSAFKVIKTKKAKFVVFLALNLALLFTTHMLMTMLFLPVYLAFCFFYLYPVSHRKALGKILLGTLLGMGLAAFYLIPLFFERQYAHFETLLMGYFDYRQHFVDIFNLFFSMEWGYGSSGFPDELLNLSLGVVHWIAGLIIAPYLIYKNIKTNPKTALLGLLVLVIAVVSIFMMHLRSSFIWSAIHPLVYLQFPWRFLSISTILLALLIGIAVKLAKKPYVLGLVLMASSILLYHNFFIVKEWYDIGDEEKFSGVSWDKQQTISIFDYLPIYATLPPWGRAPEFPEILEGKASFESYAKFSKSHEGIVQVAEKALLRAPMFDFPGMVVYVDGVIVNHVNDDCRNERYCLGLITFEVEEGKHEIKIILEDTPARTVGNTISLFSVFAAGYLLVKDNAKKLDKK